MRPPEVTEAGRLIVRALREHDLYYLWPQHKDRETELAWVRARAAYELGWGHGSADALAAFLRRQTAAQSKRAQRVGDRVRALVVNANLTQLEAAQLLAETIWRPLIMIPPRTPSPLV